MRDPLLLAKQCATIDALSSGRLLPAFGVGSPRAAEWKVTGRESKGAGARAEEGMEIIARLWREENVTFHGRHFRLEGATISPRPVQPELPLWIGGSSEAALRRTGRDPKLGFTVGDTRVLVERIRAYVDAGISKFILRPMGRDDADFTNQTRRVVDEILPEVVKMNAAQKSQMIEYHR